MSTQAQPISDPYAAYGGHAVTPSAPTATGGADPYSAYGGKAVTPNTTPAAPAQTPSAENPNNEGLYRMKSPDGRDVQIPYSKVGSQGSNGYLFADKNELQRYARDHAADPVNEGQVDKWLDAQPWYHPARLMRDVFAGAGTGALKLATAFDKTPTTQGETQAQLAAATPTKGAVQGIGELGENIGEFVGGGELADLVGAGLKGAAKYKQLSQVMTMLEQNPAIAKIMRIGLSQVKNAGLAGAQTFVKTGGDTGEAEKAAAGTAAIGLGAEGAGGIASKLQQAVEKIPGFNEYSAEARAAIEPHLQRIAQLLEREPKPAAGAGTELATRNAIVPAGRAAAAAGEAIPAAKALDVDQVLNTVHDFTGAADRLTSVNDAAYSALDKITGGKFRALNAEVAAAQQKAWRATAGTPEKDAAEAAYRSKVSEMESLMNETKGIPDNTLQTIKNSWRQSYQLRDFGNMWDRNFNGIPGASKVSKEQRGVNGVGLMRDLQRSVRTFGRENIENALGPGRLENLENIARLNQTAKQRVQFNNGLFEVAKHLEVGAVLGGVTSRLLGADWETGAALGAGAMGAPLAIRGVLNAVRTNPRIGNYLTSAIEMGARPEIYAPIVSRMIQDMHDDQARQEADQQTKQGDQQ